MTLFDICRLLKTKKEEKPRISEVLITDDVKILGHVFHGLQDIMKHVEMSLYKSYQYGHVSNKEPEVKCKVHVGKLWAPYPCFDSSDYAYENRTYQNYVLRSRPITESDMKKLSDLPSHFDECRISEDIPSDMLPLVYYRGDGNTMIVAK